MRFAIVCQRCLKEQVWYGEHFKFILPHLTAEVCPWCLSSTYLDITENETSHINEIRGVTIDVQEQTDAQTGQDER